MDPSPETPPDQAPVSPPPEPPAPPPDGPAPPLGRREFLGITAKFVAGAAVASVGLFPEEASADMDCTPINICNASSPNTCSGPPNGRNNTCTAAASNVCNGGPPPANTCSGPTSNNCTGPNANRCVNGGNQCTTFAGANTCGGGAQANECTGTGSNTCSGFGGTQNRCNGGPPGAANECNGDAGANLCTGKGGTGQNTCFGVPGNFCDGTSANVCGMSGLANVCDADPGNTCSSGGDTAVVRNDRDDGGLRRDRLRDILALTEMRLA